MNILYVVYNISIFDKKLTNMLTEKWIEFDFEFEDLIMLYLFFFTIDVA